MKKNAISPRGARIVCWLIIFLVLTEVSRAREIVPGLVSFDEPSGYQGMRPTNDPGDNPFDLSRTVVTYREKGISRPPFKQFDIGIATVGYTIGQGKVINFRRLSPDALKQELHAWAENHSAGDASPARECTVDGRKAYCLTAQPSISTPLSVWQEIYYIPFEDNRGIFLRLSGPSESDVVALRHFLPFIKIPADARVRPPPAPPQPTADGVMKKQIVENLRTIMGAGDQCSLRHRGTNKFTFGEMRQDFASELGKITPVDGENYEGVVYDQGKPLTVTTKTLGEIHYP